MAWEFGEAGGFMLREFQPGDADEVRELFTEGMSEYGPALCVHVLQQPWVMLTLTGAFLLLVASSHSLLLPVLLLALMLAASHLVLGQVWALYIRRCLSQDLMDIGEAYSPQRGARFWVAEARGQIVGMVGARPAEGQGASGVLVLKRMVVRQDYRGRGVGKALGRAVLAFACEQGSRAVMLVTHRLQREARNLYLSLGFRPEAPQPLPTFYGRLADFTLTRYRYDLAPGD
ncbi:N-acetyltransferase 8-like [Monodelphis domestica]|uniref:N-acetyltransferase 8-like n=1 Tax=Monodelphis domestica TaxID=13616 RepID=UPI0000F2E0F1|nr:N-acetyltransferase 8-like [Monodelphis domestica]